MEFYLLHSWISYQKNFKNFTVNPKALERRIKISECIRWKISKGTGNEHTFSMYACGPLKVVLGSSDEYQTLEFGPGEEKRKTEVVQTIQSVNLSCGWLNFLLPLKDGYLVGFSRGAPAALIKGDQIIHKLPFQIRTNFPGGSWSMFGDFVESFKNHTRVFVLTEGSLVEFNAKHLVELAKENKLSEFRTTTVSTDAICFSVDPKSLQVAYVSSDRDLYFDNSVIAKNIETSGLNSMAVVQQRIILGVYNPGMNANELTFYDYHGNLKQTLPVPYTSSTADIKDLRAVEVSKNLAILVLMRIYNCIDVIAMTKGKGFVVKTEIHSRNENHPSIVNHGLLLIPSKKHIEAICYGNNHSICSVFIKVN